MKIKNEGKYHSDTEYNPRSLYRAVNSPLNYQTVADNENQSDASETSDDSGSDNTEQD